jgi:hypothetical protein
MKAHEAIAILKSLDPSTEVTLLLGPYTKHLAEFGPLPSRQEPPYIVPTWVPRDLVPSYRITCGTMQ